MKGLAAILLELNKPLVLEEIEIPKLTFGQVLIDVLCSGICGSQLGEIDGVKGPDPYLPHLLGHEGSGTVLETVGQSVKFKCSNGIEERFKFTTDGGGNQAQMTMYGTDGAHICFSLLKITFVKVLKNLQDILYLYRLQTTIHSYSKFVLKS